MNSSFESVLGMARAIISYSSFGGALGSGTGVTFSSMQACWTFYVSIGLLHSSSSSSLCAFVVTSVAFVTSFRR